MEPAESGGGRGRGKALFHAGKSVFRVSVTPFNLKVYVSMLS